MPKPLDLGDPIAVLLAAVSAFRQAHIDTAVYGGLALAAYGQPRETKDADLAVVGIGGVVAESVLRAAGLDTTLTFDSVRFGGNTVSRVTLLGTETTPGLNMVYIVEPRSPRYAVAALGRAISATLRGESVRVLTPEDFVLFKVLSTRERDLEDAASVISGLGVRCDVSTITSEAVLLASELADHDVRGRFETALRLARVAATPGG